MSVASKAKILDAIRAGNNVVSLSSHGNSGYLCYLVTNDIDDVVSYPAIAYGNACLTNKFDVSSGEAFSEWMILNPEGGSVAYVGNSRFGWTGDNPIELAFWKEMLDSSELGEMFNICKTIRSGWQSYSINLLGDPAMRVWSDRPKQLNVTHASEIMTGSNAFQVTVTSGGNPVEDALVCVTMPSTLFGTGVTNASGIATLSIAPSVAGTMRVTVSGKNLIPYFGSTTVKKRQDVCLPAVACGPSIMCNQQILCRQAIACRELIGCGRDILCPRAIVCREVIGCGLTISCPNTILCTTNIGCTRLIHCGANIMCGSAIGVCPTIRPEFPREFEVIRDIWGFNSLDKFARNADTSEVQKVLEELPIEVRKSIQMMLSQIKEEIDHE